jgi:hypothetical protein
VGLDDPKHKRPGFLLNPTLSGGEPRHLFALDGTTVTWGEPLSEDELKRIKGRQIDEVLALMASEIARLRQRVAVLEGGK